MGRLFVRIAEGSPRNVSSGHKQIAFSRTALPPDGPGEQCRSAYFEQVGHAVAGRRSFR